VPGYGNGIQSHFFGLVDMLKKRMAEMPVDGISLAMTMQLDAVQRHIISMLVPLA
jgi:hypothetical protein